MLKGVNKFKSYIKYIGICLSYNLRSSLSNKKSFFIQTISMMINNCVWILFWHVLFTQKGGNINGVIMKDILHLWSIPVIAYGLCYFCFGGVETLADDIADGNLDTFLTQPKHSLISILTSKSKLSAMGDLIFGLIMGIFAVGFNPFKFIGLIAISIIASITFTAIITIIRLIGFWIGNISKTANVYSNSLFLTLTIYPEKMFGGVIKFLMYTIVPAAYVAHVPIKVISDYSVTSLIILISSTILFVFITFFLYERGLKRYESGNMINRR